MTDDDRRTAKQVGDDAWLAALAGRASADPQDRAGDAACIEGALLRSALRAWPPRIDDVAAGDPARLHRLIRRARAEGLFDRRGSSGSTRLRAWWDAGRAMGMRPVLAMTAVVAVLSGVALVVRPGGAPFEPVDVERAAPNAVTLLTDADPEGLRRRIVDALSSAGLEVTTYGRFGRYGLDADVPQPIAPAVRAVLDRYRLPVPQDDVLRVEIEAAR